MEAAGGFPRIEDVVIRCPHMRNREATGTPPGRRATCAIPGAGVPRQADAPTHVARELLRIGGELPDQSSGKRP